MRLKCIREPRENKFSPQPYGDQCHSVWEHKGLKIYVAAMAIVSLDIEYVWVAIDESVFNGVEIMRGKLKMDRANLIAGISPGTRAYMDLWCDQFSDSVCMIEFARLMSKIASWYYGKEINYEQAI